MTRPMSNMLNRLHEKNIGWSNIKKIHASINRKKLFLLTALSVLCVTLSSVGNIDQINADRGIILSSVSGPPGSVVRVSGEGFTGNTTITILLDNKPLVQTFTTGDGTFSQRIGIPNTIELGYHRVIATDGVNFIDAIFTVTTPPQITLSPVRPATGTALTISGSNFGANKHITIRYDDKAIPTVPSNLISSDEGKFSAAISIPYTSVGKRIISATDGTLVASETIDVIELASISLSTSSGPTGTVVSVAGTGFSENSPIIIKFDSTRLITSPPDIITSSSGAFSATITIPIGIAAGSITITAIDDSARAGSAIFTITPSGMISLNPSSGTGGTVVNISGSGFYPDSIITVRFVSTILATTPFAITTSTSGTFSALITIPTGIGVGSHTIFATDASGRLGSAVFKIDTPDPLTLSRTAGIAGAVVNISGSGFAPKSELIIKFDSTNLPVTAVTSNSGSFRGTITIPKGASIGTHTISVTDILGRTASSLFTVRAAGFISLYPSTGPAGTEVTVTGSKFVNGTSISIKFNDITVRTFPSDVMGGIQGKFVAKFRIPANSTEGTYKISAEDSTGVTATSNFVVTRDGLFLTLSQSSNRAGTVTLTGSGFPPNTPIKIKFDDITVHTTPLKVNSTRTGTFAASFNVPGNAANGDHTITAIGNDVTTSTVLTLQRQYIDDRYGILISVVPEKYEFELGETLEISGKVLALNNGFPVILKVINPNNAACSFQQLSLDDEMNFKAQPVKLDGPLCSADGEYKITAFYGKGKSLTKFKIGSSEELSGGKAEVVNAQLMQDRLRFDNKYTVDLDWATNAVLLRNNVNQTITFYLMFVEYDSNEITKKLSYQEVTLTPFEKNYAVAPYVPHIVNGKPDGYLHVFAWTSLSSPTPLHPGLYIPY
ncbi:MAG: hypothetical protein QXN83_07330 [Nitrososphaerales archaeon]